MLLAIQQELDELKKKHPELESKVSSAETFLKSFKGNLDSESPNFLQHAANKPTEVLQRLVDPKKTGQAVDLIENHISKLLDLYTELQNVLNWSTLHCN